MELVAAIRAKLIDSGRCQAALGRTRSRRPPASRSAPSAPPTVGTARPPGGQTTARRPERRVGPRHRQAARSHAMQGGPSARRPSGMVRCRPGPQGCRGQSAGRPRARSRWRDPKAPMPTAQAASRSAGASPAWTSDEFPFPDGPMTATNGCSRRRCSSSCVSGSRPLLRS
jgi:hypothetical protein